MTIFYDSIDTDNPRLCIVLVGEALELPSPRLAVEIGPWQQIFSPILSLDGISFYSKLNQ